MLRQLALPLVLPDHVAATQSSSSGVAVDNNVMAASGFFWRYTYPYRLFSRLPAVQRM